MKKMKKCPLCGAEPTLAAFHDVRGGGIFHLAACTKCGAQSGLMPSENAAAKAWNQIPAPRKKAAKTKPRKK